MSFSSLLKAYRANDPAAKSDLEVLLLYPGIKAIGLYRLAHPLYLAGVPFVPRFLSELSRWLTGIEIHPGAKIGKHLVIDHGMGVVIGETAEVGDDCLIFHGSTLGGKGGTGKRHPTLGNKVMVGAGAKLLGPITVGDGAQIGANAVVLKDIPAGAIAVGLPARVIKQRS
ncbi:MAG: serine O-acetyltransferase [Proteobacteria bacterium]|nr:serine O-acetyltransferase [Pseudomonadota bacterium]